MAQNTLINGNRYSFVDIDVTMNGVDQIKGVFAGVNYTATQDPGIVQGNQVAPVGRTAGYGTATGSFQMLISEYDDFVQNLIQSAPAPTIMNVDFEIIVQFNINDVDIRTDTLQGCRITSVEMSNAKGNDATMVTCNLSIMQVLLNDVPTFTQNDQNNG